ncbi:MAG: 2-hydroxyacid dehydrogenase [Planctomycetota bacterium]
MRVACFSSKPYDERFLSPAAKAAGHEFRFLQAALDQSTAVLASDCHAVCAFVNDTIDEPVLKRLADHGVKFLVMRCAGFNNADISAAARHGIRVARVPRYSPHAVAEHTIGLVLTLNRKIHKAYNRVRENNFSIDGLLGFDLHGRTFGVIGTGAIGLVLAQILSGFGCQVLLYDPHPNERGSERGQYVSLNELLERSDLVSLQCPLTRQTKHLIDAHRISRMKAGAMLINTSRGGLIDTSAAIDGLKSGQLGGLALDVYEEETGLFFEDLSQQVIQDDVLSRLMTFPNVLITSHQAFFTRDALETIARTTMENLTAFASSASVKDPDALRTPIENEVIAES